MRKVLSFLCVLIMIISITGLCASAAVSAAPTASTVLVNGKAVEFEAYFIDGFNYFKLRDIAAALSGTEKQFEVGWDGNNNAISLTTRMAYTPVGGELTASGLTGNQAALSTSAVYINGIKADLTAYRIGGFNYFKLRDIGVKIDFGVGWDGPTNTITITTAVGYASDAAPAKDMSVYFLDVGQADAIFVALPNGESMLIDAGNEESGPQIVSFIRDLGYNDISYLIATHPHADHIGGMAYVVRNMGIGSVYMPKAVSTTQTYENLLTAIQSKGLGVGTAKAGGTLIDTSNLKASFVAPNNTSYDDLNNFSAAVRLIYGSRSFLLMGDAEQLSENEITADISADVLKVGHHGSTSSTGQAFLNRVHPKYAVISVGAGNDYGHPAQATLDKLTAAGAALYRTDRDGTVTFVSDGTNIVVNKSTATDSTAGQPDVPNVIISSVDKMAEVVTIKNNGKSDVNLSGWVLVSVTGNQAYHFPVYTLKAGGSVTVASGEASGDLIWTSSIIWNNDNSDQAKLFDPDGKLVSSFGG